MAVALCVLWCDRGRGRSTYTTAGVLQWAVGGIPRSSRPRWGPISASLPHPVSGGPSLSRVFTFKPTARTRGSPNVQEVEPLGRTRDEAPQETSLTAQRGRNRVCDVVAASRFGAVLTGDPFDPRALGEATTQSARSVPSLVEG